METIINLNTYIYKCKYKNAYTKKTPQSMMKQTSKCCVIKVEGMFTNKFRCATHLTFKQEEDKKFK